MWLLAEITIVLDDLRNGYILYLLNQYKYNALLSMCLYKSSQYTRFIRKEKNGTILKFSCLIDNYN